MTIAAYWDRRYATGGTSGPGSAGHEARAKAALVNDIIRAHGVQSLLDVGCGDGVVATMIDVPRYVGYDVSRVALAECRSKMPGREFTDALDARRTFDMTLSMDVIFHQTDEESYRGHLDTLFNWSRKLCLVYGTDHDQRGARHVLHRRWTVDIPDGWHPSPIKTAFKDAWLLVKRT